MTKLSKSFVFYMKNYQTMQALNEFDELNEDEINVLFEGSGFSNAAKMVDAVTAKATQTGYDILSRIGRSLEEKFKFKARSRSDTVRDYWYIECWMHEKKPEKGNGYVIKVEIFDYDLNPENKAIGLLTCSIYDTREKGTANLYNLFKNNLKNNYEDVFWPNEWPIFDALILEDEDEEKIVEEFTQGLSKVLNKESLEKLSDK